MLAWLTGHRAVAVRAERLHAAIVEEARAPHLYAGLRVPDSTDGRFEMLALHMVLAVDRLGRMGADGQALGRALTEAYVTAMDDTMRAIGVGDLSVPRKVKKAAAGVFDRLQVFGPALAAAAADDAGAVALWRDALTATLAPLAGSDAIDVPGLTHYVSERGKSLAATPDAALLAGQLTS
jgi:cytochrome b pre-mRNA-processing protein 3